MYAENQLNAIRRAQDLLTEAGLQPTDILADPILTSSLVNYVAPKAVLFTSEELSAGKGDLTREKYIHGLVDHPLGAIVEFPETGTRTDMAIGHRFQISPENFIHPNDNIQFSLGGIRGKHRVICKLLHDKDTGEAVPCQKSTLSCRSLKKCSFNPVGTPVAPSTMSMDASGEVFEKTLGLFCALKEQGCCLTQNTENSSSSGYSNDEDEATAIMNPRSEFVSVLKDSRSSHSKGNSNCTGRLLFETNRYGHPLIRCEHFTKGHRNHLRLRNLNEYDKGYLEALFSNKIDCILAYETAAASQGYGPLVPCDFTACNREQKQLCPRWHRDSQQVLQRGTMTSSGDCPCVVQVYEPVNLVQCPYILIVSRHPHSHKNPPRTKTPKSIQTIFELLLEPLEWRLADATPRRIILDNTFIHGLRQVLGWVDFRDPGLGDLHPSLVNYDHAARLIDKLRYERYPEGTGLEGAKKLLKQHEELPAEERYLRRIETFESPNPKDGKFHIVVCMFKAMSHLFLNTKRPSIDTSFKRLHKWQEFEVEAWYPEYSRSIVVARAFTTSQSAFAHQMLFRTIFEIVRADTGKEIQFRHIHGNGIETITADGHRGQALGLGLYCQELSQRMPKQWSLEWNKPLDMLTPTQHLACIYRYCFAHFTRNVSNLRGHVEETVLSAMMSLSSADPLVNYEQVINTIRLGGKKASDWLKDKESQDGFTLAGIYRPLSKIPLDIWKAAPSTSNGNEQAHRNINRDGTKLTMLAGIMRGLQFDSRAISNASFWIGESIPPRDRVPNYFRRSAKAVRYKASRQQKLVLGKDVEIRSLLDKVEVLQQDILSTTASLKHTFESSTETQRSGKRLRRWEGNLHETRKRLEVLLPQGSGSVSLDEVKKGEETYERRLHEIKAELKPTIAPPGFIPSSESYPAVISSNGYGYSNQTLIPSPDAYGYDWVSTYMPPQSLMSTLSSQPGTSTVSHSLMGADSQSSSSFVYPDVNSQSNPYSSQPPYDNYHLYYPY